MACIDPSEKGEGLVRAGIILCKLYVLPAGTLATAYNLLNSKHTRRYYHTCSYVTL